MTIGEIAEEQGVSVAEVEAAVGRLAFRSMAELTGGNRPRWAEGVLIFTEAAARVIEEELKKGSGKR